MGNYVFFNVNGPFMWENPVTPPRGGKKEKGRRRRRVSFGLDTWNGRGDGLVGGAERRGKKRRRGCGGGRRRRKKKPKVIFRDVLSVDDE